MLNKSEYTTRKKLPHEVPPWVSEGSVYFITVCCQKRLVNSLCFDNIAEQIKDSIQHRVDTGDWWPQPFLLMPDHCHGLISFNGNIGMKKIVADWKRYVARQHNVLWQRDFFDHRIRNGECLEEKGIYIRQNPIRAGLVDTPDEWKYVWSSKDWINKK